MTTRQAAHIEILANATTFKNLPMATLGRLAAGTTAATFRRGGLVFGRGTAATGIHVVADGQLKLCIETLHGDEHVVELLTAGDCFGEAAMLTNRLHLLSAVALCDSTLLHVARATVINELELHPQLARRIIGNLSDRLYRRTSDMENILLRRAPGRVARYLLDELERPNRLVDGQIRLPARKGLIASRLNMTQEHFSRTLRSLRSSGEIEVTGGTINVVNEAGLRMLAA